MKPLLLALLDVSVLVTVSVSTVRNWAYKRKPAPAGFPAPVKVGRMLRYRTADIENYVASIGGDAMPPAAELAMPCAGQPVQEETVTVVPKRPRGRPRKHGGGKHG